jgi:hypothetical protein
MVSSLRPHQVLFVEDHEGPGGLKLTQRVFLHGKLRVPGDAGWNVAKMFAAVQATEITMHLISTSRRTLVQFVSASAVHIALSATLTTLQPAAALQAVIDTLAEPFVATVLPAGQTAGSAAPTRDRQAPMPGIVGPGLGWG